MHPSQARAIRSRVWPTRTAHRARAARRYGERAGRRLAELQPHARRRSLLAAHRDRSVERRGAAARSAPTALPEVAALQAGPVVVDGAMYFSTDTMTYAIDAGTCAEKWKRARHVATPGGGPAVNRGVAYADGRVFRGTSDAHVLALDAARRPHAVGRASSTSPARVYSCRWRRSRGRDSCSSGTRAATAPA